MMQALAFRRRGVGFAFWRGVITRGADCTCDLNWVRLFRMESNDRTTPRKVDLAIFNPRDMAPRPLDRGAAPGAAHPRHAKRGLTRAHPVRDNRHCSILATPVEFVGQA